MRHNLLHLEGGGGNSFNLGVFLAYWLNLNCVSLCYHVFCKHFEGTTTWNYLPGMKPKDSFPCSQEPASLPYPESDEFSPHPLISVIYILILFSNLHLGLVCSHPFRFSNLKFCKHSSTMYAVYLALFFLLHLITPVIFEEVYNYETPHYAVFSILLHSLWTWYFQPQLIPQFNIQNNNYHINSVLLLCMTSY
jgi:hypothetical protein